MTLQEKGHVFIVKLAAIVGVGVYLAKIFELGSVVSFLFAASIACVLTHYILPLIYRKRIKIEDMILFFVLFLSIFLSDWVLSFEYIKPAIIVVCSILCVDQAPDVQIDTKGKRQILVLFELAAVVTNIMYYFGGLRYDMFGYSDIVTLNFSNPNEAAMWLTILIVILGNAALDQKNVYHRLFLLACAASLCPILVATGSRNGMIAIAFYLVYGLVFLLFKGKRYPEWFLWVVTLAPVLVYLCYMYILLPYMELFSEWLAFLISEGKALTTRRFLWSEIQENFWDCFLFGKYHIYYDEQMHNAMATLYGRFGMLFTVIVCSKFYKAMKKLGNGKIQLAMATVWMMGCFETGIFVGVGGMYLLVLLIPILCGEKNISK